MPVRLTAALFALLAAGYMPAVSSSVPSGVTIFDTRTDPRFGDATVPLKAFLAAQDPAPGGPQHFCIVGYTDESDYRSAQVHWREGNMLMMWDGAADSEDIRDTIKNGRRHLHLERDVVTTEADINSSTYLVTRAWVDEMLADCAAKGVRYTITPA